MSESVPKLRYMYVPNFKGPGPIPNEPEKKSDETCKSDMRPKKIISVFTVTCWKELGSVGNIFFFKFYFL